MAKRIIYWGEFRSVAGTLYRVEILSDDMSYTAQRVYFPHDTPVEIEWNEVDKLEPVQGACLTLSLISEKDRQFIDLYAIEVGKVRVDVYREGNLYWSGTLDPELYEEPYSEKKDYEVSFSFSDFAPLDRKKWNKTGVISIQEVIDTCLENSGINYTELVKYISTSEYQYVNSVIDLSRLNVLCDNFYDEEGEAMTMREVLDETLRPFALRMVQKGGKIYLYDLNAIHSDMPTEEVYWDGTDAQLGVDEVYNNVKVTFSPYADAELINGELKHENVLPDKTGELYLMDADWNNAADGFKIAMGTQDGLPLTLSNGVQFFRIDEIYSGNDEAGVIWARKGNNKSYYNTIYGKNYFPRVFNTSTGKCQSVPIITTKQAFLGYSSYKRTSYQLRINLDVLFDTRYNPFESASGSNESGHHQNMQDWCNHGYIPVMLYLKDAEGNILYHYKNNEIMLSSGYKHDSSNSRWVEGAGEWGDMYLAYYDKSNRKNASGFGGWQTNKMMCGYYRGDLPKKWNTMEDGEYIDLPPTSGFLELQIGSGVHQFDYKRETKDIYSQARWLMYKNPIVRLVNKNGTTVNVEDVEDTAWVNVSAKEDLEIETIIGTLESRYCPSARGLILQGYSPCDKFTRAKRADGTRCETRRLEHLLIGTVYSQYATRHNTLSGSVRILPEMKVLTDASSSGKYIMLSEVQDLMQDTSEILMSEFVADCYDGIEYK